MNEVNILNIGGIDYNVSDQYGRDVIAHSENGLDPQSNLPVSSRHYNVGDYFIGQDRLYYEVTAEINIGDIISSGTNVRPTIISEEIVRVKNQSAIAVIQSLAYTETTDYATKGYSINDYLYWDYGLDAGLYKAIAQISENDPFEIDTNIERADKVMDMIQGLEEDVSNSVRSYTQDPDGWDTTPTVNSTKPVTSNGILQAILNQRSYVGMIIESTTLNTEAKVKAVYGGTTWIQHSGYFLRAASAGVVANSAVATGGEDSVTLSINQMPSHTHQIALDTASGHYLPQWGTKPIGLKVGEPTSERGNGVFSDTASAASSTSSPIRNSGGGQSHNNIPRYKSVYIWERTA